VCDLWFFAIENRPLVSDSLAVAPQQVEEHRRTFPDIPLTKEGQPVFTNYKQHENYLKKTGFVKLKSKVKRKGVRIV